MDFREYFRGRLRELRKERGETQKQVAEDIGITSRHYQKFESGEILPSLENFIALSKHFHVSLDCLAGRTEEQNPTCGS